jgi:acyl carrier protein
MDDIASRLTQVFRDVFHNDSLTLSPELTAQDIAGWDSLAHVTLMLSVQRAFRVRLSAAETSRLQDVGALMALLRSKQPV